MRTRHSEPGTARKTSKTRQTTRTRKTRKKKATEKTGEKTYDNRHNGDHKKKTDRR